MTYTFEKTSLWRRTLGAQSGDIDSEARERFRGAFLKARESVAPIVAQISAQLPSLTVHDITHLDALWDVADVVLGADYPITVPEAFVLGMAFLLHDAATSTAGFANGIDDVRKTTEWKDYVAQKGWQPEQLIVGSPAYQAALFEVLRLLHPRQAEKLLTLSWTLPGGGQGYLLEDANLKTHYGHVIGKISHSHWWDIAEVEQQWANSTAISLHSSFSVQNTADWKVDAFKAALILRCCDAAHIDGRRAPAMLAAILKPQDVSGLHWLFQNRLGLPSLNSHSELYWSAGKPFGPGDAEAWWLCFDTAGMVDRELRSANRLLENHDRPTFRAAGVAGTQLIPEYVKSVPVEGWFPVDVNFRVSKVSDVIEKFGGFRLYGDEPWRALRELLQNAADGVRARRAKRNVLDGRISVTLSNEDNHSWLEVLDTGIGMSQFVMTDVLLDFGRSLWNEAGVRRELPGLMSAGFRPVGQFGIGFLSVFMLGDEVHVTSWKDGEAEERQSTLQILHSVNSRPVLLKTPVERRLNEFGTSVRVRLRNGPSSLLPEITPWNAGKQKEKEYWRLEELVGTLVPTLDIDVFCTVGGVRTHVVAANDWANLAPLKLMKRIAPRAGLEGAGALFDVRGEGGSLVGRLGHGGSSYRQELGTAPAVLTHRGIRVGTFSGVRGVLLAENNIDLARTESRPICSAGALKKWAISARAVNLKKEWIYRPETRPLLSLGLPPDQIQVGESEPATLSPEAIRDWVLHQEFEDLLIVTGDIETPEDISQKHFSQNFYPSDNVLQLDRSARTREEFGLGKWVESLFPETDEDPRTALGVLLKYLKDAFPHAEIDEGYYVVGSVDDTEIYSRSICVSDLTVPKDD